jgi:hypothetical protein
LTAAEVSVRGGGRLQGSHGGGGGCRGLMGGGEGVLEGHKAPLSFFFHIIKSKYVGVVTHLAEDLIAVEQLTERQGWNRSNR